MPISGRSNAVAQGGGQAVPQCGAEASLGSSAAPWPRVSPQHGWYQMTLELMQKAQARAEQERARAGQAEDRSLREAADKGRPRTLRMSGMGRSKLPRSKLGTFLKDTT